MHFADENPGEAVGYFRKALQIVRQLRDLEMESLIIPNGLMCCVQLGLYDEALGLALRNLAITANPDTYKETEGWIEKLNRAISTGTNVEILVPDPQKVSTNSAGA